MHLQSCIVNCKFTIDNHFLCGDLKQNLIGGLL